MNPRQVFTELVGTEPFKHCLVNFANIHNGSEVLVESLHCDMLLLEQWEMVCSLWLFPQGSRRFEGRLAIGQVFLVFTS